MVSISLLIALGLLLIVAFIKPKQLIFCALVFVLLLLALQDQIRWQPWVYHYLLFLLPFCFSKKPKIGYFQVMLVGIYFWGGVHKINATFFQEVFPDFLLQFTAFDKQLATKLAYTIPVFEIIIAFGLIFQKTKKWAFFGAIAIHVFILGYLSPLGSGQNSIIIPWNIAMLCFLYICFYRTAFQNPFSNPAQNLDAIVPQIVIIGFLVLPILNFWDKWDHYLSFNLYSGKNKLFYVAVEENQQDKLSEKMTQFYVELPGLEGGELIDVNKWSMNELNVPIPPESRIYTSIAAYFCAFDIPNNQLMFLEVSKSGMKETMQTFSCEDVEKEKR